MLYTLNGYTMTPDEVFMLAITEQKRAEAAEARAEKAEQDAMQANNAVMQATQYAHNLEAEREAANQGWTNCVIKCTALQTERDEYKRRSDEYADRMINDANTIIDLRGQLEQAQDEIKRMVQARRGDLSAYMES